MRLGTAVGSKPARASTAQDILEEAGIEVRQVEGSWITDREARWFRLTAPFAAGWDRGWGFLWGT